MSEMLAATATAPLWITILPVSLLLHLIGYRRLTVLTERIGHLAVEIDCFLKKRALGELPDRRWFVVAPDGSVANRHLLSYWNTHIPVISSPVPAFVLRAMSRWLVMRYDVSGYVLRLNASAEIFRVAASWGARPPILTLTHGDDAWGEERLRDMGVPRGSWFVAVHVREAGFSPGDELSHAHRNTALTAVLPAMRRIAERGGWCIRMGDPTMTRLPRMDRVVDYAHSRVKSNRMDVFLCAKARFFLGNTSGLAFVSSIFGVPCARANLIPVSEMALLPSDICIPKLLWSERASRYLRFDEILGSPIGSFRYAALYTDAGIRPVENSSEDIDALAEEMLDRLDGRFAETDQDRDLQVRFRAMIRPGHFAYGTPANAAASFLRAHQELLSASMPTAAEVAL